MTTSLQIAKGMVDAALAVPGRDSPYGTIQKVYDRILYTVNEDEVGENIIKTRQDINREILGMLVEKAPRPIRRFTGEQVDRYIDLAISQIRILLEKEDPLSFRIPTYANFHSPYHDVDGALFIRISHNLVTSEFTDSCDLKTMFELCKGNSLDNSLPAIEALCVTPASLITLGVLPSRVPKIKR